MTHRGILRKPMFPREAIRRVRDWLAVPGVQVITPGDGHAEALFALMEHVGLGGNLTTDIHLAVLAMEYRAELATTDSDFTRFPGLHWFDPLKPSKSEKSHRLPESPKSRLNRPRLRPSGP